MNSSNNENENENEGIHKLEDKLNNLKRNAYQKSNPYIIGLGICIVAIIILNYYIVVSDVVGEGVRKFAVWIFRIGIWLNIFVIYRIYEESRYDAIYEEYISNKEKNK